jgi:hypothetical protein
MLRASRIVEFHAQLPHNSSGRLGPWRHPRSRDPPLDRASKPPSKEQTPKRALDLILFTRFQTICCQHPPQIQHVLVGRIFRRGFSRVPAERSGVIDCLLSVELRIVNTDDPTTNIWTSTYQSDRLSLVEAHEMATTRLGRPRHATPRGWGFFTP